MVKKHLYYFNRGVVIAFEIFGAIILIAAAAWLFLIIRLSQGPLNVDFLTQKIKNELNTQQKGFELDVGHTNLTWGGVNQPFEFEMQDVKVNRSDKTPVLSIDKIGIQLSKKYLVFAKFVPEIIKIHGAALRIIRDEDGSFMLNMGDKDYIKNNKDGDDFIESLLLQMKDTDNLDVIIGLKQVVIDEASLLYEDKKLGVSWRSKEADIKITRKKGGLLVDTIANIDMGNPSNAYIRGNFFYSWKTFKSNGIMEFTGFNPASFCQESESLKAFSGFDLLLKGSVAFELDNKFKLVYSRFVLGGDKGSFKGLGLYKKPINFKSFFTEGKLDVSSNDLNIEKFIVELADGAKIESIANLTTKDNNAYLNITAVAYNTAVKNIAKYWPESLAKSARYWVVKNLSKGLATKATLGISLIAEGGDFKKSKIAKLGGNIDFKDITVDYFHPLPVVKKVSGSASYNTKSFNLNIKTGNIKDIDIKEAKIKISGLDVISKENPSNIDISATLRGGLHTILEVIDSKPLEYPKKLGIKISNINGGADIDVNFKFPLRKKIHISEVKVKAKAKLKEVSFKNIINDVSLEKGIMNLSINEKSLKIKGFGELGGGTANFNWFNSFSKKIDIISKLDVKLSVNDIFLKKFGLPEELKLKGIIDTDVTYLILKDKKSKLMFKGDVYATSFIIPIMDYKKDMDSKAYISFIAYLDKEKKIYRINDLNLNAKDAYLRGNIEFSKDHKYLSSAFFKDVKIDKTDVSIKFINNKNTGYKIDISGKAFDASNFFKNKKEKNKTTKNSSKIKIIQKKVLPIELSLNVNRLITGDNNKYIDDVNLVMKRNPWKRIEHLTVDGVAGGKLLKLRYLPSDKGYNLNFNASNAGAALSALGITDSVKGGELNVTGVPNIANGKRDLAGKVMLSNFTLVNVPALGMLLNSMSLGGIFELLNGKGIAFKKMGAKFWWIDSGMPESNENIRRIRIKDGHTSGASLGIIFDGDIDNLSKILNIKGTIIPASGINKLIGAIPLIGGILTGGEGVFAATYKIKGPINKPKVIVNPLSVFAPGIFRKIFFN